MPLSRVAEIPAEHRHTFASDVGGAYARIKDGSLTLRLSKFRRDSPFRASTLWFQLNSAGIPAHTERGNATRG